ncbi:hypothetical protein [Kitasatospora sp. NBC_01266]|uniref:hypothetical protein n=1 Tax=Kitasatospora sp. NBC_01266 TaxID=2903572 RepID=UPI002E341D13|nr:hypothetical protein [Kitasatospora sp. NBC_01266]
MTYQDPATGSPVESAERDLLDEADPSVAKRLIAQSKDTHVLNCYRVYATGLYLAPGTPQHGCSSAVAAPTTRDRTRESYERYFSAKAREQFPAARILAVRTRVLATPVTPYAQRNSVAPPAPAQTVADSGWQPYIPGVGR